MGERLTKGNMTHSVPVRLSARARWPRRNVSSHSFKTQCLSGLASGVFFVRARSPPYPGYILFLRELAPYLNGSHIGLDSFLLLMFN